MTYINICYLNLTSSLIDFMLCRRQYQRRNSKSNVRICWSVLISCTPSVPVYRLLWWTSLWHNQHNDYGFTAAIRKVVNTDWWMFCRKSKCSIYWHSPPTIQNHPASSGLVTKIPTTQETFVLTNIQGYDLKSRKFENKIDYLCMIFHSSLSKKFLHIFG
jgi:hypothetical protein